MWIYAIGIRFYRWAIGIASLFHPKARAWVQGRRQFARRYADQAAALQGCVWFHCASLGEFEQGRPLMEMLRREQPGRKILLTFYSPSGYEIRHNFPGADLITYLPLDTRRNARMFLDLFRPSAAIFVKYEFWHIFIRELSRRKIPLYLISGLFRPGHYFFRPWGGFGRNSLRRFTRICVQDEASAGLLNSIKITSVSVTGDNRVDRAVQLPALAPALPALERFLQGNKALVFGSTWAADEALIKKLLPHTRSQPLVLVPHDPSEAHLRELEQSLGEPSIRYAKLEAGADTSGIRIVLMDRVGLLVSIYRYAWLAYVGGGFGRGIHNILEPAAYGIPIVFGPVHRRFREAVDLVEQKAAFPVEQLGQLREILDRLYQNDSQLTAIQAILRDYLNHHTGGTQKVYRLIFGPGTFAE